MLAWHPRRIRETGAGIIVAAVAFVLYAITACRTVTFIDSGELATVAWTMGIAHPTGYPLFSVLSWIFAHLPLGLRPIFQLNLMAAFFCSVALFVFFRFMVFFLREVSSGGQAEQGDQEFTATVIPAAFGTLVLGFSETYWAQALAIEVYSLHLLLIAVVLWFFLRAISEARNAPADAAAGTIRSRAWFGFAFSLGLAFTNHMTTILLAPAFITLFFTVHGFGRRAWKRIALLVPPFLLGFSLYLYLPLRAAEHPVMNWGDPASLQRFLWHFSGKQYRVWIFSSTESAAKQMKYFIDTLPGVFAIFPLLFALAGLVALFRRSRRLFVFTLLLFAGCILYSINYDIHDIDSYFLLAYVTVGIWAAVGAKWLLDSQRNAGRVKLAAAGCIAAAFVVAGVNYNAADESGDRLVEEYTRDVFRSVDSNALVISYQWDYFVSSAYYFQLVEDVRPDVMVIDKELMRRSWYYEQLGARHPALIAASKPELEAFLVELAKFEQGDPYDPMVIESRYARLIRSFIERNIGSRPVYVTPEIEGQYTAGYQRVPTGLVFRLYADTLKHPIQRTDFHFAVPEERNPYVDGIVGMYARAYVNNGIYLNLLGRREEALEEAEEALKIDPEMREAEYLRQKAAEVGR